ncbi:MAG: hypothetical protein IPI17_17720 [Nitrosomonas sp.]|nr:hypothetical protein [Nitrosomonas sp.]
MKSVIPDILIISGIGAVSYGFYLINEPYGFIVAGILTLAVGIFAARAGK